MGLADLFNFSSSNSSLELPNIFPFSVTEPDFVTTDVTSVYAKILKDVLERTQGIKPEQENLMWDNCVASESSDGLVSMLSKAMCDKRDLFLVYKKELKLIRKADPREETLIREDYKLQGTSKVGTYISFKNYGLTDLIKIYSSLEYCTVASLSKNMNLSKAIQVKILNLRGSVGLSDRATAEAQALAIAEGLADGDDVMLDAGDTIETAKPDLTATEAAMVFINRKRSFYLGLPESYITGERPKGMGDSGSGDAKAIERGLKNYYFSIIKPTVEAIFEIKTSFKSENFDQITPALEAMKTFELTSGELISQDNKRIIMNKLFGLPEDEEGDAPEKVVTLPGGPDDNKPRPKF